MCYPFRRVQSLALQGLCSDCSHKLNFHHQKKEVIKKKKHKKEKKRRRSLSKSGDETEETKEREKKQQKEEREETLVPGPSKDEKEDADVWRETQTLTEEKTRDEEFEEYLQDLLF